VYPASRGAIHQGATWMQLVTANLLIASIG
jgi:hypothetical protein